MNIQPPKSVNCPHTHSLPNLTDYLNHPNHPSTGNTSHTYSKPNPNQYTKSTGQTVEKPKQNHETLISKINKLIHKIIGFIPWRFSSTNSPENATGNCQKTAGKHP